MRVARLILEATPNPEANKPEAGPSRPDRDVSPVRYSVYNSHLTYIYRRVPIMSPRVLVRCPPFSPCSSLSPCPPCSPPGTVYIHPRPPTPYPLSPPPPPPAPRPVVYQQAPFPVPVAPVVPAAAPVAPVLPDQEPWWYGLLQGPHCAAAATLLHRYLSLLETTVDYYM